MPLDHAEIVLGQLREEAERASRILQDRYAGLKTTQFCANDSCKRPIRGGAFFTQHSYRDVNFILRTIYACSQRCWVEISKTKLNRPVQTKDGRMVIT